MTDPVYNVCGIRIIAMRDVDRRIVYRMSLDIGCLNRSGLDNNNVTYRILKLTLLLSSICFDILHIVIIAINMYVISIDIIITSIDNIVVSLNIVSITPTVMIIHNIIIIVCLLLLIFPLISCILIFTYLWLW